MAQHQPPSGDAIISARGLTQSFCTVDHEQTVLNGLDVDIRRGDFTAIMGPSGAGKSTLLYALAGLERPAAGTIAFDGEDLTAMRDDALAVFRRSHCGFVFQQHQLLERMSLIATSSSPVRSRCDPSHGSPRWGRTVLARAPRRTHADAHKRTGIRR